MYGTVKSAWRLDGGQMTLDVTIPANVTARIILPTGDTAAVREDGNPLLGNKDGNKDIPVAAPATPGETVLAVDSGSYHFSWPVKEPAL